MSDIDIDERVKVMMFSDYDIIEAFEEKVKLDPILAMMYNTLKQQVKLNIQLMEHRR